MNETLKRTVAKETVKKIGEKVNVQGWAATVRDHGSLIFIDLRDWTGIVQVVVNEKDKAVFEKAKKLALNMS